MLFDVCGEGPPVRWHRVFDRVRRALVLSLWLFKGENRGWGFGAKIVVGVAAQEFVKAEAISRWSLREMACNTLNWTLPRASVPFWPESLLRFWPSTALAMALSSQSEKSL